MRHLPPLNALRVFEVATRTGSYTAAASELGLTHGAVSRQIALLENWLGQRLFSRSGRRMVATPMARIFAAEVSGAFERMTAAAEACGRPDARRILRVNAPVSFAMRWLIPGLEVFHAAYPSIEIVVTTVSTVHEELRGGFDVAIRRGVAGAGAWPHHHATHVLDDVDTLIMSPSLFSQRPILGPADLEGHKLLASETRPGDWIDWLEAAKLPHLIGRPRTVFDHFFITRQAVMDGLGVGIGPLPMLDIDIALGHLVTPLPDIQVRRTGYVALLPKGADNTTPSTRFVKWLAAEGMARHQQPADKKML
ncbi:LysR substrate-binding domain-containing protein [Acetobacter cerevisiae]|uniref:LysR family transcriptional regulator n=1 Tax=Acetobacter cerevisiae TaxID=178900 RepID=A0A149UT07_9PROT|nr:LysR substrate-binding domain-containing protein [Acetobacter cerevisiae]KXV71131.1 LysR family transcriptional regulator [Acetobacter cerevisiae]MCP1246966.1 LysR substrate-binding domain-containing protein [Acetobacter cerevisiae]MCP1256509.1 LysR substrate-binding domain-containing protein [Acetobacter cerevisiae]